MVMHISKYWFPDWAISEETIFQLPPYCSRDTLHQKGAPYVNMLDYQKGAPYVNIPDFSWEGWEDYQRANTSVYSTGVLAQLSTRFRLNWVLLVFTNTMLTNLFSSESNVTIMFATLDYPMHHILMIYFWVVACLVLPLVRIFNKIRAVDAQWNGPNFFKQRKEQKIIGASPWV